MDADLKSIAAARRMAERAFDAYQAFLGTDPAHVDAIVDAMARAVEPEAERLGQMAVDETGYGNVPDKRVKNLVKECEAFAENSEYPPVEQLYDVVYEQKDYPFLAHKL